ncbi:MAG: DUF1697 domain-containing protein [bacterium]
MIKYVAFLRGINVGGHKAVKLAQSSLKRCLKKVPIIFSRVIPKFAPPDRGQN